MWSRSLQHKTIGNVGLPTQEIEGPVGIQKRLAPNESLNESFFLPKNINTFRKVHRVLDDLSVGEIMILNNHERLYLEFSFDTSLMCVMN